MGIHSYKTHLGPSFKETYTNYSLIAGLYAFNTILIIIKAFLSSFCFKLGRPYILELLLSLRLPTLLTLLAALLMLLIAMFVLKS